MNNIRIIVCLGLSIVTHLCIFFIVPAVLNRPSAGGGGQPPAGGPMKLEVAKVPPVKQEKAKPQRLTSNDEKLKENKNFPKQEQPAPSASKKKDFKESTDTSNQKATTDKGRFVTAEVAEKPKEKKTQTIEEAVEEVSKKKNEVIKSKLSSDSYRRYLTSLNIGKVKGKATPQLMLAFHDVAQLMEVHKYYGMKVILLNPSSPRTVVELTGLGTQNVDFQKITNFNWKNYSNRIFPRTEPFFRNLKNEAVKKGLLRGKSLRLVSITPNSPDSYFRYKQINVSKQNGHHPDQVSTVIGRFVRTDAGYWILKVEKIRLKTGETKSVQDFEYQKIRK
ncbi:MAG: hypothetical protein U9O87_00570 [Verrucomicrobiota bacterium]|nr:hypothetical protein [Verrucomicrobiota bacterium]